MNLQHRIDLMVRLGEYLNSNDDSWKETCEKAFYENGWFIPEFIQLSASAISRQFLRRDALASWSEQHSVNTITHPLKIGIVMAGNIPLVGFHDFLSVFISGHRAIIKPSSRDKILIEHIVKMLVEWSPEVSEYVVFQDMLKDCDAYIATGSNNSSRYFEFYFARFPHIIRKNRTSVAILHGKETEEDLKALADDVYQYFGRGCRNVTKIYVPKEYDFIPLLNAFRKYNHLADHHKYKNNYDYNLALHLLNKQYYMSNESLLIIENTSLYAPISQLNYEFYEDEFDSRVLDAHEESIQCIIGAKFLPFGSSQEPALSDYADDIDTLSFLTKLQPQPVS